MIPLKKEKGIAVAAIGIASSILLAPSASARDQVRNDRPARVDHSGATCQPYPIVSCYGVAGTGGFIADGAAARFNVAQYSAPDANKQGHTNQTLWVNVNNSSDWCEVGWTKGFKGDLHYFHYWGYGNAQGIDAFAIYYQLEQGASYHYQIKRFNDNYYDVEIDNYDFANCNTGPFTLAATVGLEMTSPDASAAAVEPRELQWRRATDLVWFDWGSLGTTWDEQQTGPGRWSWITEPTHGKDWTQH